MSPLALISVSDKKNIIPFCTELVKKFNYKILSSGGTARHLEEANIFQLLKLRILLILQKFLEEELKLYIQKYTGEY